MFDKVAIIGIGLLGGSLAKELKRHHLCNLIVGVCRSEKTAEQALAEGVVDHIQSIAEAVKHADLIVIATPMQAMSEVINEMHSHLSPTAIVTDVGSVKTDLYRIIHQVDSQLISQFVLAHPIAGAENSGVAAATLDLFLNKHVIITQTDEVAPQYVEKIKLLWEKVGARVVNMSLQEHDQIFSKTSHLPHVIAFTLVNYLSAQDNPEKLFDLAASGFYDFTRIASSDAEMWRDICISNKDEVLLALGGFRDQLDEIIEHINQEQQNSIFDYFNHAKLARNKGLLKKSNR